MQRRGRRLRSHEEDDDISALPPSTSATKSTNEKALESAATGTTQEQAQAQHVSPRQNRKALPFQMGKMERKQAILPPASPAAPQTTKTTTTMNGVPERSLRNDFAYNEMTMGANGSVMNREEKLNLRNRYGYCTECEGPPTLLYNVKKNRLNPLWVTKEPRAVSGECAGGICFLCHPQEKQTQQTTTPEPLFSGKKKVRAAVRAVIFCNLIRENAELMGHVNQSIYSQNRFVNTPTAPTQTTTSSHVNQEEYQYWLLKVRARWQNLEDAPENIRNQKEIVMAAVKQDGKALDYASPAMQNDREVVMAAVKNDRLGWVLKYASPGLRGDKKVVMAAVQKYGEALKYATEFQNDREVVIAALRQNADAFKYVPSKLLQQDKEVAMVYIRSNPDNIKCIHEDLKRDPDILIAAGMFDEHHDIRQRMVTKSTVVRRIALSTRFSLNETSHSAATQFTKLLKRHKYIQEGGFKVYPPNAFDKKTCDPNWTDYGHPCRGTKETCQYDNILTDVGHPTDDCCWRYSFRYQLDQAKATGGFMLQLVEKGEGCHNQELGNGQKIERNMAQQLEMKIFHVCRPMNSYRSEYSFNDRHISEVVNAIKGWYDDGCQDMSECVVHPTSSTHMHSKQPQQRNDFIWNQKNVLQKYNNKPGVGNEDDDNDIERPNRVIVSGAGNQVVNGEYARDGYFKTVVKFSMPGNWEGKTVRFALFQCTVSNNTKHWYISIVPVKGQPGTSADLDFYTAPVSEHCQELPPLTGWTRSNEGRDPSPTLSFKEK